MQQSHADALWRRARRPLSIAVIYVLAWYPLDQASQKFQTAPDVSVWYPPAGLDVGLLLVFGLRYAPLLLLNSLAHTLVLTRRPIGPAGPLIFDLVAPLAYTVAAALLLRVLRVNPRLRHLRDVTLFVAVAPLGAAFVVAVGQVVVLAWTGILPWTQAIERTLHSWAGIATGIGLLAPPLLVALRAWPGLWAVPEPEQHEADKRMWAWKRPTRRQILEVAGETIALAIALLVAYGTPRGGTLDYTYVLFVPLLWIAVRHGFARSTVAVLVLNVGAALLVRDQVQHTDGLALQFGLMTVTLTGLLLGAFMSERRLLGDQMAHQALHDPLTGLANRLLFGERIAHALARAVRQRETLAVLLLDLDHFKTINDSRGHAAGDAVLVAVAARLAPCVRPSDTVARLGGDEFAILLEDLPDPGEAGVVAARLLAALHAPVPAQGRELALGASIGIALHTPDREGEPEALLRDADVALYRAKEGGRGRYMLFDPDMHTIALARLELEADLRRALQRDELVVYYQPIVDLATRRIVGLEALARWPHPRRGLLAPGAFIPLAEDTGLIVPLGRWVLRMACQQIKAWPTPAGSSGLTLSVNLSGRQLQDTSLAANVETTLQETGLEPARLVLEITESVFMRDVAATRGTLQKLKDQGVRLALDDFGAGYSSLGYLRDFPIDLLKMDKSFIAGIDRDDRKTALARVIVDLGRALDMRIVAEGIETEEQYARVRDIGCPLGQGYDIAPPLPPDAIQALLTGETTHDAGVL